VKKEDARQLERGEPLLTTDGRKVKFVEITTVTEEVDGKPGRRREVAVVELPDGTTAPIPPRSLHRL
jgi:hypothetical protein